MIIQRCCQLLQKPQCSFKRRILTSDALNNKQSALESSHLKESKTPISLSPYRYSKKENPIQNSISRVHQSLQSINKALRAYENKMQEHFSAIKTARTEISFVQKSIDGSFKSDVVCINENKRFLQGIASTYPTDSVPKIFENGAVVLPLTTFDTTNLDGSPGSEASGWKLSAEQIQNVISFLVEKNDTSFLTTANKYAATCALLTQSLSDPFMKYCKAQKLDVSNLFAQGVLMVDDKGNPQSSSQFRSAQDDSKPDQIFYGFAQSDLSNVQEALNKFVANLTSLSDQWTMRVQKLYQTWNYLCQSGSQIQVLGTGLTKNAYLNWK